MSKNNKKDHPQSTHTAPKNADKPIPAGSFEAKVMLFWKRYKSHIFLVIVLAFFMVIGVQGVKLYKIRQVAKLQERFLNAKEDDKELEFAYKNPLEPLSGVVLLDAGDKDYTEGQYEQAIDHYERAIKALRKTPLKGRGRLGVAMANIMNNSEDIGKTLLDDLVEDRLAAGVFRAQASYQLALMALEDKDYKTSAEHLDAIQNIPDAGIWEQKAAILAESTPELTKN